MTGPTPRANQAEMRRLIAAELVADPSRSNRRIATALGVSSNTVASVRGDLETGGEIPHLTRTVGADGKSYGARRTDGTRASVRGDLETGGEIPHLTRTVAHEPEPVVLPLPRGRMALSVAETAQALGVSRALVHQACRSGRLHSVAVGTRRLIPVASLRAWLSS